MNDFQKGWLEGFHAATSRVVMELATKHGPEGMKIAPEILKIEPPRPPAESQVERMTIEGGDKS